MGLLRLEASLRRAAAEAATSAIEPKFPRRVQERRVSACNKDFLVNTVRGCRGARRMSASRDRPVFENEAGLLVHSDPQAATEIACRQVFACFPARRGGVSSGCADCS